MSVFINPLRNSNDKCISRIVVHDKTAVFPPNTDTSSRVAWFLEKARRSGWVKDGRNVPGLLLVCGGRWFGFRPRRRSRLTRRGGRMREGHRSSLSGGRGPGSSTPLWSLTSGSFFKVRCGRESDCHTKIRCSVSHLEEISHYPGLVFEPHALVDSWGKQRLNYADLLMSVCLIM